MERGRGPVPGTAGAPRDCVWLPAARGGSLPATRPRRRVCPFASSALSIQQPDDRAEQGDHTANGQGCGRALRARAGLAIILRGPSRGTFSRKQAQRGSLGGWGRCPSQEVLGAQPADPSRAPFNEWGSETCTAQGSCTKPRTCTPCLAQKGQKTRALCRGTPPPLAGEAPHKLPFRAEHRAESGRP